MMMRSKGVALSGMNRACTRPSLRQHVHTSSRNVSMRAEMQAVVFGMGSVVNEPAEEHLEAYNSAFKAFEVTKANSVPPAIVQWSDGFFKELTKRAPTNKLSYFFESNGWGANKHTKGVPNTKEEKEELLAVLQQAKAQQFQDLVDCGVADINARPGVERVIDETKELGMKLAVVRTSTDESHQDAGLVDTLKNLLGEERAAKIDCALDVDELPSPDPEPAVYVKAAAALGVQPNECVCIEDSDRGLRAALGAGMRVVVTYTDATKTQAFEGAERIVSDLAFPANITALELKQMRIAQDDRLGMTVSDTAVSWEKEFN